MTNAPASVIVLVKLTVPVFCKRSVLRLEIVVVPVKVRFPPRARVVELPIERFPAPEKALLFVTVVLLVKTPLLVEEKLLKALLRLSPSFWREV